MWTTPLPANPRGGVVVHGDINIGSGVKGNLQINQNSRNAIINWDEFSIDRGELTQFRQPGANAAVLNRVTGGNPSAIHGALRANGNVFVINPNGILVGASGSIDVHSLVLSTLDVSNGEFLAGGDMVFEGGSSEGVTNMGRINAIGGDVFLIGRTVQNSGSISATGTVGLGAGQEVLLTANETATGERMFVRSTGAGASGTGVLNDGTIEGAAVELKAHGNVYALAINNKGSIRATGVENRGGRVFLEGIGGSVRNSGSIVASGSNGREAARVLIDAAYAKVDGTIRASGGVGGTVRISASESAEVNGSVAAVGNSGAGGSVVVEASEVMIGAEALVDASGASGGGKIQIGGGFQGNDAEIRNAQNTLVEAGSTLVADATGSGNGGEVIVWADESTKFSGEISAQALGADGDGGFVEVSGKRYLSYDGTVSTLAANGSKGTLLLDPNDVEINSVSTIGSASLIGAGAITAALGSNNVVISTNGVEADAGDIFINESIVYDETSNLSFLATRHIRANASVQNAGTGAVNLVAGWDESTGIGGSTAGGNPNNDDADMAAIVSGGAFGLDNGSGAGSVFVGDGSQTSGIAVGSLGGSTNVAAFGLFLDGSDTTADGYAQLGYNTLGITAGTVVDSDFSVDLAGGNLELDGGDASGAFAHLGHGGMDGDGFLFGAFDFNMDGGDVFLRGGSGNDAYVQLGHGGRNHTDGGNDIQKDGDIDLVGFSDLSLLSGEGLRGYTQIGHGGHFGRNGKRGDITITGDGTGDVVLLGGQGAGQDSYAQIGMGGRNANNQKRGFVEIDGVRNVSLTGGVSNDSYAHVGMGGINASGVSGGSNNSVAVNATGDILLQGGSNANAYAQIGVGGVSQSNNSTNSDPVSVTAGGSVSVLGGSGTNTYAQIGHGGTANNGSGSSSVTVTAGGSGLRIEGGSEDGAYAQVGHGGAGSTRDDGGTVTVTTTSGNVEILSGSDLSTYAQVGHGGSDSVGVHSGAISIDAAGNLVVTGGSGSDAAYALVGHGGARATGSIGANSDILINQIASSFGGLALNAGGTEGSFAQVGHGGWLSSLGVDDAAITIDAAFIVGNAGAGDAAYVMIGHGGFNESRDAAGTGLRAGWAEATRSGDIDLNVGGNFDFNGGSGIGSFAQVGHGGRRNNAVDGEGHSGTIDLDADSIDIFGGSGAESYAMAGHGGYQTTGNHSGDIILAATGPNSSAGRIRIRPDTGGNDAADRAFTQVGHGGFDADFDTADLVTVADINTQPYYVDNRAANLSGNIMVTSNEWIVLRAVESNIAQEAYSQIGHGGFDTTGNFGLAGETITVSANGELVLFGGQVAEATDLSTSNNYAQVGHGGAVNTSIATVDNGNIADPNLGNAAMGSHTGDISVITADRVRLDAGSDDYNYVQIGHGGVNNGSGGGHSGDILVRTTNADAEVYLQGGAGGGLASPAQIGHGGRNSDGNHNGSITVEAGSDVILANSGSFDSFNLIGHGGIDSTGNFGLATDDITVTAGRNVQFNTGSNNSFNMIGLGGMNSGGSHTLNNLSVTATTGFVDLGTGGGENEFKLIGLGGSGSGGDMTVNDIAVEADGDITLTGNGGNGFSMIGVGGFDVDGTLTANDISVTSNNGAISLTGGSSGADAFAHIGVGGRSSEGDKQANSISVMADGDITLTAGDQTRNYAQIGSGGHTAYGSVFSGDVDVISTNGGVSVIASDLQNQSYAHIGHGGRFDTANGNYLSGTMSGNITVSAGGATGDVVIDGGGGTSYAQVGHGGYQAGRVIDGTAMSGIIDVDAGQDLLISGGVVLDPANSNGYAKLGHGGSFTDGNQIGDIQVDVGRDITLTGGGQQADTARQNEYVQIGHGGSGVSGTLDGRIDINRIGGSGTGNITLTGGDSDESYALIGHGGQAQSGAIGSLADSSMAITTGGNLDLTGGTDAVTFAQVGHGGQGSSGDIGGAGFGSSLTVNAGGAVSLDGGTDSSLSNNAFAQIGFGGSGSSGSFAGDIFVIANDGVRVTGGADTNAYALIGHGGWNSDGATRSGAITVTGDNDGDDDGAVLVQGGLAGTNADAFAQIGHGGAQSNTDILDSSITVTASAGEGNDAIGVRGGDGQEAYAQIGHGGDTATAVGVGFSGAIDVTASTGDIVLESNPTDSGTGNRASAQIGHGGLNNALVNGDFTGSIDLTATAGAITLAASDDANNNVVQIGHGGTGADALDGHGGDIRVTARDDISFLSTQVDAGSNRYIQIGHGGVSSDGNHGAAGQVIEITSTNGGIFLTGGNDDSAYSQIGNGGLNSDGNHAGDITLSAAGEVRLTGGIDRSNGYALVGHGGTNSDGTKDGTIDVTAGSLVLQGRDTDNNYAQLGHGGRNSTGDIGAASASDITVVTDGDVNLAGNQDPSGTAHTQLGHGGFNSGSDTVAETIAGAISVTSNNGDVLVTGSVSGSANSYTQLGHAGYDSDYSVVDQAITVTATNGVVTLQGSGSQNQVQIGHGGEASTGDYSGDIGVTASGNIALTGGSNGDSVAQIGHGGADATGTSFGGNIDVHSVNGAVSLTSGTNTDASTQIGHGGPQAGLVTTTITGDICVVAGTNVTLDSSVAGGAQTYTQIGHGGFNQEGSKSGDITVVSGTTGPGGVTLVGGNDTNEYAQIGHGGINASGDMAGDITVTADNGGSISLTGGVGTDNYAMIGHGDGEGLTTTGTREGGIHLFADDTISATNGAGVENVNIYHQGSGSGGVGLVYPSPPGNYLGGDGFQVVGNNAVTLANSAVNDIGAMVEGNMANGPVNLALTDDVDITVGPGNGIYVKNENDFYILTGGSITMLQSYQQYGDGDVILVAGWDGTGFSSTGRVDYADDGMGGFNYCEPSIVESAELDLVDFNCDSFGNDIGGDGNFGTITIGDGTQTSGIAVGTRGSVAGDMNFSDTDGDTGRNFFAAHSIVLNGSDDTTNGTDGYAQLGFRDDNDPLGDGDPTGMWNIGSDGLAGRTDTSADIVLQLKDGGLILNGGDAEGAYTQIGHGGRNADDNRQNQQSWIIDISFCEPGDVVMNGGGGLESYAQIGHGSMNSTTRNRHGNVSISGFENIDMNGGIGSRAFVQIGNGGYGVDGAKTSNTTLTGTGTGSITMDGGDTADNAYALIGLGGNDLGNANVRGDVTATGIVDLTMNAGDGDRSTVHFGHGGWEGDQAISNADSDIIIEASGTLSLFGGAGLDSYAQVGHGGRAAGQDKQGDITIDTGMGIVLMGGSGSAAYTMIGHGGMMTGDVTNSTMEIATDGSIQLEAGTSGNAFAMIGHGGGTSNATITDVDLSVTAGQNITLQGGTADDGTFAHIGHGGRNSSGDRSGVIEVTATNGFIDLIAGLNNNNYAQIGHGGHDADFNGAALGTTVADTITVSAGTDIRIIGAQIDNSNDAAQSYAQIGHGGEYSDGSHFADITVSAGGSITVQGGMSNQTYAQIGHGGLFNGDSDKGDASGSIDVDAGGDISVLGGLRERAYGQIGHGGFDHDGTKDGDIDVEAGGAITVEGGQDFVGTYAQIGHGGENAEGVIGTTSSNIRVVGENDVQLIGNQSGGGTGYAQVGHGGLNSGIAGDSAAGTITLASNTGGVFLTGSANGTGDSFVQIGHGGVASAYDVLDSAIDVDAAGAISLLGSGAQNSVMIGHGGERATGTSFSGAINADAGTGVSLQGGTNDTAGVQIGHGGSETNATLSGTIDVVSTSGDISLSGGSDIDTFAQIGHGGRLSAGDKSGAISLGALDGNVGLSGGNENQAFAQVGHGGHDSDFSGPLGGTTVDSSITVEASGDVEINGTSIGDPSDPGNVAPQAYAAIGHGGQYTSGDLLGDILVNAGGGVTLQGGASNQSNATIGHGGLQSTGAHDGMIEVRAVGDVSVSGGSRARSYAQIGHGGDSENSGDNNGHICVISSDGSVLVTGGSGDVDANAIIGHGGHSVGGTNLTGDISIAAALDVTVTGGSSNRSFAQIGHGGIDAGGNMSGDMDILVGRDFSVNGGSFENAYGLVGHGSAEPSSGGNRTGSLEISVGGGSTLADNDSVVRIGHGSTGGSTSGDFRFVTTTLDVSDSSIGLADTVAAMGNGSEVEIAVTGGDLRIGGAGGFVNSDFDFDFVASGDVIFLGAVQNGGMGEVSVVAGWDGTTGLTNLVDFTNCPPISDLDIDYAQIAADPAAYGNGQTVIVGDGTQISGASVGSAGGTTNILSEGIVVQGSDTSVGGYAQIGYFGTGGITSGDINLIEGGAGLSLLGGSQSGSFAQMGHGGTGSSGDITGDILVNFDPMTGMSMGVGSVSLAGGAGQGAYVQIGHGGVGAFGSKSGDILLPAEEVSLAGGSGMTSFAQIGHGGANGLGDIAGTIEVSTSLGDLILDGGSGIGSRAQIGHGGTNYTTTVLDQSVTVDSAGDLLLRAGSGREAGAVVGHFGLAPASGEFSGALSASAAGAIELVGGVGGLSFAQIGHGGGVSNGSIAGDIEVVAGTSIEMRSSNLFDGAYAKIGHGDDFRGALASFGSEGARSGNITVAAGSDIGLTSAMIGHSSSESRATSTEGVTQIGVSRDDPTDENGGTLTADADSVFSGINTVSGDDELRFYLPRRENNRIAAGAELNGIAYGGVYDPWEPQGDDEFTINLIAPDGSTTFPNEHGNVFGTGPNPPVPDGFAFYYDTLVLETAPPPVIDDGDGSGGPGGNGRSGSGGGTGGGAGEGGLLAGFLKSQFPGDRLTDDEKRKKEKAYTGFYPYYIYYEGYDQYGPDGESVFTLDDKEKLEGGGPRPNFFDGNELESRD